MSKKRIRITREAYQQLQDLVKKYRGVPADRRPRSLDDFENSDFDIVDDIFDELDEDDPADWWKG